MKRLIYIIICVLSAASLLCACGDEETVELIVTSTPTPRADAQEAAAVTPVPTMAPAPKLDEESMDTIREHLTQAAEACRDIYESADKGTALNVALSSATVQDMVIRIGQQGLCAADAKGTLDMQCSQQLESFGEQLFTGGDCAATYYLVYADGQIAAYHLSRSSGVWTLSAASIIWGSDNSLSLGNEGSYAIDDVRYTDSGWLIYKRDLAGLDQNQSSNSSSYVFVRVKPYDETKLQLCRRYVEPIGYFENNLFTSTWSETNMVPIDFNSLYSQLFGMYNGTENLSARNELNYYSSLQGSDIFIIPTSTFENTVQTYFDISSETLKAISDYSAAAGGYMFLGYRDGYYNVTPRTPTPEVVDYLYNGDGTVTMRVCAVNKWYGTESAFTHDLTVRIFDDGSFKYVSNTFYESDANIVPERRLSYLLDVERTKTDY